MPSLLGTFSLAIATAVMLFMVGGLVYSLAINSTTGVLITWFFIALVVGVVLHAWVKDAYYTWVCGDMSPFIEKYAANLKRARTIRWYVMLILTVYLPILYVGFRLFLSNG